MAAAALTAFATQVHADYDAGFAACRVQSRRAAGRPRPRVRDARFRIVLALSLALCGCAVDTDSMPAATRRRRPWP